MQLHLCQAPIGKPWNPHHSPQMGACGAQPCALDQDHIYMTKLKDRKAQTPTHYRTKPTGLECVFQVF